MDFTRKANHFVHAIHHACVFSESLQSMLLSVRLQMQHGAIGKIERAC